MTEFPEDDRCGGKPHGWDRYCTNEPTNVLVVQGGGRVTQLCEQCLDDLMQASAARARLAHERLSDG